MALYRSSFTGLLQTPLARAPVHHHQLSDDHQVRAYLAVDIRVSLRRAERLADGGSRGHV